MDWKPLAWIRKKAFSEKYTPRYFQVTRLARYNSEKMRGIVHTDEWAGHMEDLQDKFNKGELTDG